MNRITLIGRIAADPEKKQVRDKTLVTFRIAHNVRRGDREHVSYFDVQAWNAKAEALAQYGAKGRLLAIEGRLHQERWESDDGVRSRIVIHLSNFQFLDPPKSADPAQPQAA